MSESVRIVVVTASELRELIQDAVTEAVGEPPEQPRLLDRVGLAQALDISTATLARLRAEDGFPELRVGDAPRFELEAVLAWLRQR